MEKGKNILKGKRILIFQQRSWGLGIGHFLARKLAAEGCKLAAVTFKPSTSDFIARQKEVKYELIINDDEVTSSPKSYLSGEQYSLEEICAEVGVDSVWPLIHTVRNFVKSYGGKYYYSFKQNVPDEMMTDYVKAVYKYLKRIFNEFRPDAVLAPNFVVLPFIMCNLMAEKRGIKMIAVTDSKITGRLVFSEGYRDDRGEFCERIDALNSGVAQTQNRPSARDYIRAFRENFIKPDHAVDPDRKKTLWQRVRHELAPYYHILRWFLRPPLNRLPSLGPTIDYRPPRIILRDHYSHKRYRKFMENFRYFPFEQIGKYVYFPLQFQPESSMDVIAPFFSNQIEVARLIAMSLPGDYALVVKEHPAMVGLRSPSYIEKVNLTPNVKFVDYRLASDEVIKKADLVISPNSTTLAEAAFMKKPAIQLGDLGITLKLPNVFRHTDFTSLAHKIREALKADLNTSEYERKLENFVAAAFDTGFTFPYAKAWSKGLGSRAEELWQIYQQELKRVL